MESSNSFNDLEYSLLDKRLKDTITSQSGVKNKNNSEHNGSFVECKEIKTSKEIIISSATSERGSRLEIDLDEIHDSIIIDANGERLTSETHRLSTFNM